MLVTHDYSGWWWTESRKHGWRNDFHVRISRFEATSNVQLANCGPGQRIHRLSTTRRLLPSPLPSRGFRRRPRRKYPRLRRHGAVPPEGPAADDEEPPRPKGDGRADWREQEAAACGEGASAPRCVSISRAPDGNRLWAHDTLVGSRSQTPCLGKWSSRRILMKICLKGPAWCLLQVAISTSVSVGFSARGRLVPLSVRRPVAASASFWVYASSRSSLTLKKDGLAHARLRNLDRLQRTCACAASP